MRKTTSQFIAQASTVHKHKYDYSLVDYKNNASKVIIICETHGVFAQTPINHLQGTGCPTCAIFIRQQTNMLRYGQAGKSPSAEASAKKKHTTLEKYGVEYAQQSPIVQHKMIQSRIAKYGVEYITQSADVILRRESANILKYGVCYPNQQHMINALPLLSDVNWLITQHHTLLKPMAKIADELGVDQTTVHNYLKRNNIKINKYYPQSIKCIEWFNYIMTHENILIQHTLNGGEYKIPEAKYSVDGYCKETNTVYEFHGDYWHGNPKSFEPNVMNKSKNKTMGELYNNTIKRENNIKSLGYNLITMWESDYISPSVQ